MVTPANTPMRWPASWKDAALLELLKGSCVDCLLADASSIAALESPAKAAGIAVIDPAAGRSGVAIAKGAWPGVRMARGAGNSAGAGPTGVPWVDSNGWLTRLTAAMHSGSAVWVDAPPQAGPRIAFGSYLVALADTAAYGGRWIISLDDQLAANLAAKRSDALDTWKHITAAAAFFHERRQWAQWAPEALVGVVSDFTGKNEFLGQELLNLLDRAGVHFRIVSKGQAAAADFKGLRSVIYADEEPPAAALRRDILAFVDAGGLLITAPVWGVVAGKPAAAEHPRFQQTAVGKGAIARAVAAPDDPYELANDAAVLVSHRYDLVRCWNSGAFASHFTVAPDRKKAVVHLLFYANRGPDAASVRIAGRWRSATYSTVEQPAASAVEMEAQKDAVEVHLPRVSQYVAVQLEG